MKTQKLITTSSYRFIHTASLLLTVVLSLGLAESKAAVLLTENFAYSTGSLGGQGSWVEVNPDADNIQVVSGNLTVSGLEAPTGDKITFGGSGADATKTFTSQTTGSVYYTFALNVTNITSLGTTTFSPFIGLSATTLTDAPGAAVWARKDSVDSSTYNLGIAKRTGAEFSSIQLSLNTTYFVAVSYEFVTGVNNDIVKLWIAPSSASFGGSAPAATLTYSNVEGDRSAFGLIGLTQSAAANTPVLELDSLRIGNTWAEVTPIPEPGTSILLLAGLGLTLLRRRQNP